jgi:hypothetical protein
MFWPVSSTRFPRRCQPSVGPPRYGPQLGRVNHTPNAPTHPETLVLNLLSMYRILVSVKPPRAEAPPGAPGPGL